MFSPDSFKAASFAPESWEGVEPDVTAGQLSGSASLSITATGALTEAGACSSWSGTWQGQWQGEWGGCIGGQPPGSMVGLASFVITATGTLTNGATVDPGSSGGYSTALWWPFKKKPIEEEEALLLAVLM